MVEWLVACPLVDADPETLEELKGMGLHHVGESSAAAVFHLGRGPMSWTVRLYLVFTHYEDFEYDGLLKLLVTVREAYKLETLVYHEDYVREKLIVEVAAWDLGEARGLLKHLRACLDSPACVVEGGGGRGFPAVGQLIALARKSLERRGADWVGEVRRAVERLAREVRELEALLEEVRE